MKNAGFTLALVRPGRTLENMVAFATEHAPQPAETERKNRARKIFLTTPETRRGDRPRARHPRREKADTFTKTASGVRYYGYRFYSPGQGRFLNRDPIEEQGGLNLYGFVGNDPINAWDYLGLSIWCWLPWVNCDEEDEKTIVKGIEDIDARRLTDDDWSLSILDMEDSGATTGGIVIVSIDWEWSAAASTQYECCGESESVGSNKNGTLRKEGHLEGTGATRGPIILCNAPGNHFGPVPRGGRGGTTFLKELVKELLKKIIENKVISPGDFGTCQEDLVRSVARSIESSKPSSPKDAEWKSFKFSCD